MSEIKSSKKNRWLRYLLFSVFGAALVLVLFVNLYFSNAWFKTQLEKAILDATGRTCSVGSIDVSLLGGQLTVNDLRLENADTRWKNPHTLSLKRMDLHFSTLGLIFSSGSKLDDVRMQLDQPEIVVERLRTSRGDVTNIDDLIERFGGGPPGTWPKQTGLRALSASLRLEGGTIKFIDNSDEVLLNQLALDARIPQLGQALTAKASADFKTPWVTSPGKIVLDTKVIAIDSKGMIDLNAFSSILLNLGLNQIDVAYASKLLGIGGKLSRNRLEWTLGQPVTANLLLEGPELSGLSMDFKASTLGPISLFEKGVYVAGNLPSEISMNGKLGLGSKIKAGPFAGKFVWASNTQSPNLSTLNFELSGLDTGTQQLNMDLLIDLTDLLATDLGKALKLQDMVGGKLKGTVRSEYRDSGHLQFDARLNSEGTFITYKKVRQETSVSANLLAQIQPNAQGVPEEATLELNAKGSAFEVVSLQPIKLSRLSDPEQLIAEGLVNCDIRGQELWREFGQLLAVFNLTKPIEEHFQGSVKLSGNAGNVHSKVQGILRSQVKEPQPIKLDLDAHYDGGAMVAKNAKPYGWWKLSIASVDNAAIAVDVDGSVQYDRMRHILDLPILKAKGDIATLDQRFGNALSKALGSDVSITGGIDGSASLKIVSDGQAQHSDTAIRAALDFTNLDLSLKTESGIERWHEDALKMQLEASVQQQDQLQELRIPNLKLDSVNATTVFDIAPFDISKLSAALSAKRNRHKQLFEALPDLKVTTDLRPAMLKVIAGMKLIPLSELLAGQLQAMAGYERDKRSFRLERLTLNGEALDLKLAVPALSGQALAAYLDAAEADAPGLLPALLPPLTLELVSKNGFFDAIKRAQMLPEAYAPLSELLSGQLQLAAGFDENSRNFYFENLQLQGSDTNLALKVKAFSADALLSHLHAPASERTALLPKLLPQATFELDLKERAFEALKKSGLLGLPIDLNGNFKLAASYDNATDRLDIAQLQFQRSGERAAGVHAFKTALKLHAVKALLSEPLELSNLNRHLPGGLLLEQAVLDPTLLATQLHASQPAGWSQMVADGQLRFGPLWKLERLTLQPQAASWAITGSLDVPLRFYESKASTSSQVTLSGPLVLPEQQPLSVKFDAGGQSIAGKIDFTATELYWAGIENVYAYSKPPAQPCTLQFQMSMTQDGALQMQKLELQGGPLELNGVGLEYATLNGLALAKLERLQLTKGPLPLTLSGVRFDQINDKLAFDLRCETVNLAEAAAYAALPTGVSVDGSLQGMNVKYDGKYTALLAGNTNDAELQVLTSLQNLRLQAARDNKKSVLSFNGALVANPRSIRLNDARVNLDYVKPGAAPYAQTLPLPLTIQPLQAGQSLLAAAQAPGLPLSIQLPLGNLGGIDLVQVQEALDLFSQAFGGGGAAKTQSAQAGSLDAIKSLRFETGFSLPKFQAEGLTIEQINVPQLLLSALVLQLPSASAKVYQGSVTLSEGRYDLSRQPLSFTQRVNLNELNMAMLTHDPAAAKDAYKISGALSGNAAINGQGIEVRERSSWAGTSTLKLDRMRIYNGKKNGAQPGFGMLTLAKIGTSIGRQFQGIVGILDKQVDRGKLVKDIQEDFNDIHLHPFEVLVNIDKGRAQVAKGQILGKDYHEGLALTYETTIDLATRNLRLVNPLIVTITKINPSLEEKMFLNRIDPEEKARIMRTYIDSGRIKLVYTGTLNELKVEYPTQTVIEMMQAIQKALDEQKAREAEAEKQAETEKPTDSTEAQKHPEQTPKKEEKKSELEKIIDRLPIFGK